MSQSGYTPIQLYRTTTAAATPTSGNLAAGELAINLTDEKLYFKNAGGTVKLLASTDTLGTVTSVAASGGTTGLTFSGSPITTSGTLTLGGTLAVANGGTGTTTAFTAGSVVFAGASGVYSQDNANLFWDNTNDRLGIGTASPQAKLHLLDTNAVYIQLTDSADGASRVGQNGTAMTFGVDGANGTTERMRIDSSGNVGIGVTPSAWSSMRAVQVGTAASFNGGSGYNDAFITSNAYFDGTDWRYINSNPAYYNSIGGAAAARWYTSASGTAGNAITFTQAMAIDVNGNIAMGTGGAFSISGTKLSITNPAASNTYVSIYGGAGSTNGGILLGGNNAENFANVFWNTSSNLLQIAATPVSSAIKFDTAGSERMRIDASGNLLVGTTAAVEKLTIGNGSAAAAGINLRTTQTDFIISPSNSAGGGVTIATSWVAGGQGPLIFTTSTGEILRFNNGSIVSPSLADAVGYKGLPQNSQTSSYTLALSDMGKHISITTGGVVIPANGSVAFPIGATIVVFNNSGSTQTISITTDTLRLAGTATTGSRTLAQYGLATLVKVTSTVWVATGNVT
jgi:hypothetical protein